MAIKIQGTTIIDDAANVSNICIINATAVCASANLYGSGANLTNLPPSPVYACGIACSTIAAGDPVSLICCNCGVAKTVGSASPGYLIDCASTYYPSAASSNYGGAATLKFCCSENCFATLQFIAGGCVNTSCCINSCMVVRTHCISDTGTVSSSVLCTYTCAPCGSNTYSAQGRIASIPGCSGTTGAFLTAIGSFTACCLNEIFLCYCTTSNTISVLRNCTGPIWGTYEYYENPFVTPDGKYFISVFASACANNVIGGNFLICCTTVPCSCCAYNLSFGCANACIGMIVKTTSDTACYLTATAANSCTNLMRSALPATNAWVGGCIPDYGNNPGGYNPFSYGADGWLMFHLNVCNTGSLTCCCAGGPSLKSAYFAVRPIGDNCYAMSTVLRPDCGATNTLMEQPSCSGTSGYPTTFFSGLPGHNTFYYRDYSDMGFIWDRGDNVKRQLVQTMCLSCTGGTPTYNQMVKSAIQCFCVAANTCLYALTTTCWCHERLQTCINNGNNLSSCNAYYLCIGNFMSCISFAGWCGCGYAYTPNKGNGPWPTCRCGQIWNNNLWNRGVSTYLNLLYETAVPLCHQLGCYYFMTSTNVSRGIEAYSAPSVCSLMDMGAPLMITPAQGTAACYISSFCNRADCCIGVSGRFDGTNYCLCTPGCVCAFCSNTSIFQIGTFYNIGYSLSSFLYPASLPSSFVSAAVSAPVVMKNGSFIVGLSDQSGLQCGTPMCTNQICKTTWTLGVASNVSSTPTVARWIGIAQNSASPGQTVCYATPGMVDASPFSCCVCALTTTSITAGWDYCMMVCCCGFLVNTTNYWGINCVNNSACCYYWQTVCCKIITYCPGNALINGYASDCNYVFCYYCTNIQFTPIYDQGLGKWTTTIEKRPASLWPTCCAVCFAHPFIVT
jgi:hypothetical protein